MSGQQGQGQVLAGEPSWWAGAELVVRWSTAVLALISLALIASDTGFNYVPAFNYLLATCILAFLYFFAQAVVATYHKMSSRPRLFRFAFYINISFALDLLCAILLLSGSSAAFGVTSGVDDESKFFSQANASASLALVAFCFALASLTFSTQRLISTCRF